MSGHSELGEAKELAKGAFGPYLAWFAIMLVGFWPHFVWNGKVGWIVTAIWLAVFIAPAVFLVVTVRLEAARKTARH